MKNGIAVRNIVSVAACVLGAAFALGARAENGVTASEVTVGMCNVVSGPAAALGTGLRRGSQVYFDKVNKAGGVNGRRIRVIAYDDGYEPRNTVAHTRKLIEEDKVFALFGYVGTPTSTAIMPLVTQAKIPFWAPFTGAEFLRHPVNPNVFNVRASYFDEAETQVRYLADKRGLKRIAVFYQNDAYGLAVKGGLLKALRKRNLDLAGEGTYERNTEDVGTAVEALKRANPDAVSMVGTYKAMAVFIRKARAMGFNPMFLNVSFVGTAALARELESQGDGVMITQVMPSPEDGSLPIVADFVRDMKAAGQADADYTDFEGYVDAVLFVEALRKAGASPTRDSFRAGAESLTGSIGGLAVTLSNADHQALEKVYLTVLQRGRPVMLEP